MIVGTSFRRHMKDTDRYSVELTLESDAGDQVGCPYSYKLVVEGFFKIIDSSIDDRTRSAYVTNAGPSILFGAAREFLLQLTSRGPHEAPGLPMIAFPSGSLEFEEAPDEDKHSDRRARAANGDT